MCAVTSLMARSGDTYEAYPTSFITPVAITSQMIPCTWTFVARSCGCLLAPRDVLTARAHADHEEATQKRLLMLTQHLRAGTGGAPAEFMAHDTRSWLETFLMTWLPSSTHAGDADIVSVTLDNGQTCVVPHPLRGRWPWLLLMV